MLLNCEVHRDGNSKETLAAYGSGFLKHEVGYNIHLQGYSDHFIQMLATTPNGMWVFDAKFCLDRKGMRFCQGRCP